MKIVRIAGEIIPKLSKLKIIETVNLPSNPMLSLYFEYPADESNETCDIYNYFDLLKEFNSEELYSLLILKPIADTTRVIMDNNSNLQYVFDKIIRDIYPGLEPNFSGQIDLFIKNFEERMQCLGVITRETSSLFYNLFDEGFLFSDKIRMYSIFRKIPRSYLNIGSYDYLLKEELSFERFSCEKITRVARTFVSLNNINIVKISKENPEVEFLMTCSWFSKHSKSSYRGIQLFSMLLKNGIIYYKANKECFRERNEIMRDFFAGCLVDKSVFKKSKLKKDCYENLSH